MAIEIREDERCLAALNSNPWFAGLSPAIQLALIGHSRQRPLPAGRVLCRRGDEPDGLYAILEGTLRASGTSEDGKEAVLNFYGPGSWLGEMGAFDRLPRANDLIACTQVLILHLPGSEFEMLMSTHPDLPRAFLRLACMRLRTMLSVFESYTTQPLEQRFASRLLSMVHVFGAHSPRGQRIGVSLSQETLAQMVGTTRQRVNQLLKAFERRGLLEQRYARITILDPVRLADLAREPDGMWTRFYK